MSFRPDTTDRRQHRQQKGLAAARLREVQRLHTPHRAGTRQVQVMSADRAYPTRTQNHPSQFKQKRDVEASAARTECTLD